MFHKIKLIIKKILACIGLYHPSLGIKISSKAKATMVLTHKRPEVRIFVETGTEYGTMIDMVGNSFEKIYTIELNDELYQKACEHYRGQEKITLLHGDSGIELRKALQQFSEPAVFWLDAHPPGDINADNTPIIKELETIFSHSVKNHVILVDDARKFDIATIGKMKHLAKMNDYRCSIQNGIFIFE